MNPRTILFIHQAFPGQFKGLLRPLAEAGHKLFALCLNPQEKAPGVTMIRYMPIRQQLPEGSPSLLREMDARLIRGESVYKAMKTIKQQGIDPDIIYVHPGWGEALFVRNVWPKARLVVYAEWYYNLYGQEVNFDPALPPLNEEQELRLTLKNTCFLHALGDCDAAISPTEWQRSRFPEWAQKKITVIHDGLNIKEAASVKPKNLGIPSQKIKLTRGMPIVTYSARHLEPVRGFHYFMRSLPAILEGNREAHVIIMGQDAGIKNIGYGRQNPQGTSWRKTLEDELGNKVDWSRVHFLGMLERNLYLAMLKLSACHVYLTTPFILSWSFLEAAALGLPILASDTAPVHEFDKLQGLDFVGFTDVEEIANKVLWHLSHPNERYFDANAEMLQSLDSSVTVPAIIDILLQDSKAKSFGNLVEDLNIDVQVEEEQGKVSESKTKSKKKRKEA